MASGNLANSQTQKSDLIKRSLLKLFLGSLNLRATLSSGLVYCLYFSGRSLELDSSHQFWTGTFCHMRKIVPSKENKFLLTWSSLWSIHHSNDCSSLHWHRTIDCFFICLTNQSQNVWIIQILWFVQSYMPNATTFAK